MAKTRGLFEGVKSSPLVEARNKHDTWPDASVAVLSGYLEKTDVQGKWRLYRTLDLQEYIEFDESTVLHIANERREGQSSHERPPEHEPVLLWFDRTDQVRFVRNFLAGDLSDIYMPQAQMSLAPSGTPALLQWITRAGGTDVPVCKQ